MRSVSRQAIAALVKKGRFRTLKIGGKVLVHREDVKAFVPKAPGPEPKTGRSRKKTVPKKAPKRAKSRQ
jgi:excisionase family DNA binding protein